MGAPELPPLTVKRLSLGTLPPRHRFEQWREHMDHLISVVPNGKSVEQSFHGDLTVYQVGEVVISRCLCDAVIMQRTLARISTTGMRDYMFQLFLDGDAGTFDRPGLSLQAGRGDIVVLDFNEPVTMRRGRYDTINLFLPRHMVDAWLPAGVDLHCAHAPGASPLAAIARGSVLSFLQHLPDLIASQAQAALIPIIQLLVAAVSGPADSGLKREVTANLLADAALGPARQYIEEHLDDADLDAAAELVRNPSRSVLEIAYGLGFSSPSDFSRAFRRLYGYSPRDVRLQMAATPSDTGQSWRQSGRPNRPFLNWLESAGQPDREA